MKTNSTDLFLLVLATLLPCSNALASQKITDVWYPKESVTGLYMSSKSSLDGVCKALGLGVYLENSKKFGSNLETPKCLINCSLKPVKIPTVRIDGDGLVVDQVKSLRIDFLRCIQQ